MDTSDEYIKMCDCPEVQKHKDRSDNQYLCDFNNIWISHKGNFYSDWADIWLPRQDQIQEMIETQSGLWIHKHNRFFAFVRDATKENHAWPLNIANTLEKAWIVFYMHEKHKKYWTGKNWEKY